MKRSVIIRLTLARMAATSSWYSAIIYAFFSQKGLTLTEILSFKAIFSLAVLLFEVPTGIIADVLSRKLSLMLSTVCITLFAMLVLIARHYIGFVIAQLILGLGNTFYSGALEAAVYDHLRHHGQEEAYGRIYGQMQSRVLIVNFIAMTSCSFLYAIHPSLPFVVTGLFAIVGTLSVAGIAENLGSKQRSAGSFMGYGAHIVGSAAIMLQTPALRWILVYQACFVSFVVFIFELYQYYFTRLSIPVALNGTLYGLFMVVGIVVSKETHRLFKRRGDRGFVTSLLAMFAITILAMGLVRHPVLGIAVLVVQQILYRAGDLTISRFTNEKIMDSTKRATLLSFASMSANGVKFLVVLAGSYILQMLSFGPALFLIAVVTLVLSLWLFLTFPVREHASSTT